MISFKSSSIHTFSGDNNPGILKKLFWLIINLIRNNFFSLNKDLSLKLLYQNTPDISANLKKIDKTFSPSRKLADLYWLSLPTNEIIKTLGKVKVLDIGCGNGIYYYLLKDIFGENLESYTGFDKKLRIPNELKNEKNVEFIEDDVKNLSKLTNNYNFIISNSFIEHIDEDLKMFEDLKIIEKNNNPTLQLHIFPARACLFTYLAHGIRQYSVESVSKISKIFNDDKTKKFLIGLGSKNISSLHFKEFTIKKIFRIKDLMQKNNYDLYLKKFQDSYKKDLLLDKKDKIYNANFYALILQTNFTKDLDYN